MSIKKHSVLLIPFYLLSLFFLCLFSSCRKFQVVEFAKKFGEIERSFKNSYWHHKDRLDIAFKEVLSYCVVPYSIYDLKFMSDPISDIYNISAAMFLSKRLNIPIPLAFSLKDLLDFRCNESGCRISETSSISHKVHYSEKRVQENYVIRMITAETGFVEVKIKAHVPPYPGEMVLEIDVRGEDGYKESLTYALSITESNGLRVARFIWFSSEISCYSVIVFRGDIQRNFELFVFNNRGSEKFFGSVERDPSCPQRPKGKIDRLYGIENIERDCSSLFESSNIEFLFSRILEEEGSNGVWFPYLKRISEDLKIFEDEIRLSYLIKEFNSITAALLFTILFESEKIQTNLLRLDKIEDELKKIKIAFPKKLYLNVFSDFQVPITHSVGETEKLFLEFYIELLRFVLLYLDSLELTLDETTKNQVLNKIRSSEYITLKDKVELISRALKSSPTFLSTRSMEGRKESYEHFKKALIKLYEFSHSVGVPQKTGFFKFAGGIPRIPSGLTEIVDDFVDHKDLTYYLGVVSSLLKSIYRYSEAQEGFIVYLLDKFSEGWQYNAFALNVKRLILADLRRILPAMYEDKDNFIIEWECGGIIYSYERFPESITCEEEPVDTNHFFIQKRIYINGITGPNPFYGVGLGEDGFRTRFPYILFPDPSFSESLQIKRTDIFKGCQVGDERYRNLCILLELIAFLTAEN